MPTSRISRPRTNRLTAAASKKGLDWRAVIQGLVGSLLLLAATGLWNKVGNVGDTINNHSKIIESIPAIQKSVDAANSNISVLDRKIDDRSNTLSQKIDDKTKGIVTWEQFNVKSDKITDAVDKLKTDNAEIKGQLNAAAQHPQILYPVVASPTPH